MLAWTPSWPRSGRRRFPCVGSRTRAFLKTPPGCGGIERSSDMRQPINGSLAGRLLARVFLVSLLLAGSTGCVGAMLMVPGLAGVGAGGYLWGKEATRDKTPDTENV